MKFMGEKISNKYRIFKSVISLETTISIAYI